MNIYATHRSPRLCAAHLDNSRRNKAILEVCQMLSTVLRGYGCADARLYRSTHEHHPCTLWAGRTQGNYEWMLGYLDGLHTLYKAGSGRDHASFALLYDLFESLMDLTPEGPRLPSVNCARNKALGLDFTHVKNVNRAYRLYLQARWELDAKRDKKLLLQKGRTRP